VKEQGSRDPCHFWKESGKGRTKGLKEKTTMCERKLLRVF